MYSRTVFISQAPKHPGKGKIEWEKERVIRVRLRAARSSRGFALFAGTAFRVLAYKNGERTLYMCNVMISSIPIFTNSWSSLRRIKTRRQREKERERVRIFASRKEKRRHWRLTSEFWHKKTYNCEKERKKERQREIQDCQANCLIIKLWLDWSRWERDYLPDSINIRWMSDSCCELFGHSLVGYCTFTFFRHACVSEGA